MDIKVETKYGNVTLKSNSVCSDFYDAYDDNGNQLGELWNLPKFDENDKGSIDRLKPFVENAIECQDIGNPSNNEEDSDMVYLMTILERIHTFATARSQAFYDMEKCKEVKAMTVKRYTDLLSKHCIKYEVRDAGVVFEVESNDKSRYLCITVSKEKIQ